MSNSEATSKNKNKYTVVYRKEAAPGLFGSGYKQLSDVIHGVGYKIEKDIPYIDYYDNNGVYRFRAFNMECVSYFTSDPGYTIPNGF